MYCINKYKMNVAYTIYQFGTYINSITLNILNIFSADNNDDNDDNDIITILIIV
jgi:hypothetical protein